MKRPIWRASQKSLLLPCATGWLPISTLAVDWKFILWREENKYLWTGDMDMDTLPETGIEWLLTEWWMEENSPALFLSVGSQNASNHTFPSTQEIGESSVKNLTGKRKDPKVVTSETPPRSLYRKVQIQDAHLYTAAFRQLFSPSLSLSKTHYLWLTWNQRECLWCQWKTKTNGGKATRKKQIQCKKRYPSPKNLSVSSTIKDNFLSVKQEQRL